MHFCGKAVIFSSEQGKVYGNSHFLQIVFQRRGGDVAFSNFWSEVGINLKMGTVIHLYSVNYKITKLWPNHPIIVDVNIYYFENVFEEKQHLNLKRFYLVSWQDFNVVSEQDFIVVF